MKKFYLFLILTCIVFSQNSPATLYVGQSKADLDSVTSSYATISWGIVDAPKTNPYPVDALFEVTLQVRDDSKFAGYSNKASASFDYYDTASWGYKPNNPYWSDNTVTKTGPNERFGKYNYTDVRQIAMPFQTVPIVKYRATFVADTKGIPTKTESKEFYVAKTPPSGNKSAKVKAATASWYASRLELVLLLTSVRDQWNQLRVNNQTFDYNAEMRKILLSTASLAGPSSPSDYGTSAGWEMLGLVSNVFGNVATSALVGAGGVIFEAYAEYKWCKELLASSFATWDNIFGDWVMASGANAGENYQGDYATKPSVALNNAINAIMDEANEAVRIVYISPNDSSAAWRAKLQTERDKLLVLAGSFNGAKSTAAGIINSGPQSSRDKYNNFCDMVNKIANTQYAILNKALTTP